MRNLVVKETGICGFSGVGAEHAIRITFYSKDFEKANIRDDLICSYAIDDDRSEGERYLILVPKPTQIGKPKRKQCRFTLEKGGQLRMTIRGSMTSKTFRMKKVIWQLLENGYLRIQVPPECVPDRSLFKTYPLKGSINSNNDQKVEKRINDLDTDALLAAEYITLDAVLGVLTPFPALIDATEFIERHKLGGANTPVILMRSIFKA